MQFSRISVLRATTLVVATAVLFLAMASQVLADDFSQTNLVSDMPGLATTTDPNLVNPWGIANSATSPFWISDQKTGLSTLYDGSGNIIPLVVSIPAGANPPNGPTGIVFSGGAGFNGSPSFIFATKQGTIATWAGADGTTAAVSAAVPGAVYTGLALDNDGSLGNLLYAANNLGGIDVFNSSFSKVVLSGSFVDPNLPAGYTPYNIQNIGGDLYVEYSDGVGLGKGIVDVFDANGNFIKRLITGGSLDDPWGIALAPAGFGSFGGDLLVGNFGNGEINAFNPTTGAWIGTLDNSSGTPIVNSGLWALEFRIGGAGVNTDALYFTAGINGQKDGLFGSIQATPEPGTLVLLGSSLVGLIFSRRNKK
jgi:uncharacterized protein (TIGR03118 family)